MIAPITVGMVLLSMKLSCLFIHHGRTVFVIMESALGASAVEIIRLLELLHT